MIITRSIVRQNRAIRIDKRLQPCEIWIRVLFIVDFDADAHTLSRFSRIQAKLRSIGREGLIPGVYVRDTADRQRHSNASSLEVINDGLCHSDGYALRGGRVGGFVEQSHGMNKAQND